MKYLKIFYIIFLHVILALTLILYFSYPKQVTVYQECQPKIKEENKVKNIEKVVHQKVNVIPHPPDFMYSREVVYRSYKNASENGKSIVIFEEYLNGNYIFTKVDEDAIQWK
jgi:hypothetical protein